MTTLKAYIVKIIELVPSTNTRQSSLNSEHYSHFADQKINTVSGKDLGMFATRF
jgi:hypothetical protein